MTKLLLLQTCLSMVSFLTDAKRCRTTECSHLKRILLDIYCLKTAGKIIQARVKHEKPVVPLRYGGRSKIRGTMCPVYKESTTGFYLLRFIPIFRLPLLSRKI